MGFCLCYSKINVLISEMCGVRILYECTHESRRGLFGDIMGTRRQRSTVEVNGGE